MLSDHGETGQGQGVTTIEADKKSAESAAEYRAVSGECISGTPAKISLANPESIRQEMARVYREARGKQIDSADAAKLIYMLSQITKA